MYFDVSFDVSLCEYANSGYQALFFSRGAGIEARRRAIAVYSRLRSLKFAYVSSGSHDLAGQAAFLFLVASFFLSFSSNFSRIFLIPYSSRQRTEKGRPAKEANEPEEVRQAWCSSSN